MLKIGFGDVGVIDKRYERTIIQLSGVIKLSDKKVCIGNGSRICVYPCGTLAFEGKFFNTAATTIICHKLITFGENVVVSWHTLIMDTDLHFTENPLTKEIYPQDSPVTIGDCCWICARSTIVKGSNLPKGSILSSAAVLTKKYDEEYVLLAGSPATIKKHNITLKQE